MDFWLEINQNMQIMEYYLNFSAIFPKTNLKLQNQNNFSIPFYKVNKSF